MKEFYETRKIYRDCTGFTKPLTYEDWSNLSDQYKSAVLFIQFFDQILLAYNKAKSYDVDECEAIEVVNQYLEKNVDKIKSNPSRFSPSYIYRVAYNCIYCICHDRLVDKRRREYEVDPIVETSNGETLNIMDLVAVEETDSYDDVINGTAQKRYEFWKMVEDIDQDSEVIVNYLLGIRKDLPKKVQGRKDEVIAKMRSAFEARPDLMEMFLAM